MTILLFWVNFLLKSLLSGFPYAQKVPDKLRGEYLMKCYKKDKPIIGFLVFFVEIASKLEKVGPILQVSIRFYPCHPAQEWTGKRLNFII